PMTDDAGQPVAVNLGGVTTLRWTVLPGNHDIDYLAFIPVNGQPPKVTTLTLGISSFPAAGGDATLLVDNVGLKQLGTFSTDFNFGLPPGTRVYGNAFVDKSGGVGDSGALKLTVA